MVFLAGLLGLIASIPVLTRLGWRNALAADGKVAAAASADPTAPGYRAVVSPTPTMLVVHRGPEGSLASVALLASAGDSGGGAVLLVPATVLADPDTPRPRTLAAVYASGGIEELSAALGRMFRIGFQQVVTEDPRDWERAAERHAPLRINNPDEVLGPDGEVAFEAGEITLQAQDFEPYLRLRNPGEEDRSRVYRSQVLWTAWLGRAASAAAPGETDDAFSVMVAELGRGRVEVLELPVDPAPEEVLAKLDASSTRVGGVATGSSTSASSVEGDGELVDGEEATEADSEATEADGETGVADGGAELVEELVEETVYVADPNTVRPLVASIVPFPSSAQPGDRVRVRLLDGLGDPGQALNVSTLLVPAGAEIAVFGNADSFDYAETVVEYYVESQQANAEVMAGVLGLASASYNPAGDATVDVSVTVGRDLAQPGVSPKVTMPSSGGGPRS